MRTIVVAFLTCAFLLAATAFFMERVLIPIFTKKGEEVEVPNVVSMKEWRALSVLSEAGLSPVVRGRKFSQMEEGTVIEQDPPSGMRVKKGRKVYLIISLGEEPVRK